MKKNKIGNTEKEEVLSDWVLQFSDALFQWAYYKTSDQMVAEDMVQDTFLAAFQSFEKFQQKSSPKTWLFSILNHKIIDHYRKHFRDTAKNNPTGSTDQEDNSVLDYLFDHDGSWKKEHQPQDWQYDDTAFIEDAEFGQVMQYCMAQLPERWFSAIQSKYLDEKDGKEICQELGITPSNFWQILHRAKLQLRHCLEHHWFNA